jgi:hypothetical protein
MVNNRGFIIHKLGYKKGKRHDYDIYKENHPLTPKDVVNVVDIGYLGIKKDIPGQLSSITKRKKRNRELLQEEINFNQEHTRKRIIIEHTICRLKNTEYLQMYLETN